MSELPDTPEKTSAPPTDRQKGEISNERRSNPVSDTSPIRDDSREKPGSAEGEHRTLGNHPADPNAWTNKINIPPGISAEDAADPGNATPGATPVDNRSGEQDKRK